MEQNRHGINNKEISQLEKLFVSSPNEIKYYSLKELPFLTARVLMQDFTGVPSVVDIASIRSEVTRKGGNPEMINPKIPVDLIIDHSVQVDFFGTNYSYQKNVKLEYERNHELYS